ncbi:MAG: hypothetical protein NLN64_04900 [Candidatus Thalassarchaeaceae archaeon]|nr:hypothetical protein [Candidatus Thalassarchaeaceae archaeon]
MASHYDDDEVSDAANCPMCLEMTEHDVLKRIQKGKGEDILARCLECNDVHLIELRPPAPIFLNTTFSEGKISKSGLIEVDSDEIIAVGDIFQHEGADWEVTRIDDKISKPEKKMVASEIYAMWVIRTDKKIIKITLTDDDYSTSSTIESSPDKVFSCGTILEINGQKWRIRAIHTGEGRTLRGKRVASEIKRMYLHSPRTPTYD